MKTPAQARALEAWDSSARSFWRWYNNDNGERLAPVSVRAFMREDGDKWCAAAENLGVAAQAPHSTAYGH